jgi:anti-sigma factor RsiW
MKCGKLRDELMEAVLSGPELANPAVQEHLATCAVCTEEVASLRRTMDLLGEWQSPEPSPYFSARMRARMREERTHAPDGFWAWLRRPAIVTAAVGLIAVGVSMLEGIHWKTTSAQNLAQKTAQTVNTSAAVSDLQYLDNHADLFADFDALDDDQTETN